MKKLVMLMLLAFPAFAHSEVETKISCFKSQEGKDIKFEFRTYHDQAAKWSGAAVKYATSKESIPLVYKSTEQEEMSEGRPFQFTTTWVEVVGGAITGEYVMVRQGALIYGMSYTNAKSKKHYGFEHHPQIESSPEKGCQW
ncbi:hypothetical protein [Pseudomonas svalbardensis]|uniref:hypothetical protein n=1 Tax=Pseudomonas svalbardensis TaxID=3042029 RepID=UPI0024B37A3D|nr:hypothetical protein [Pseudomonas sp. PMCC200367]